MTIFAPSNTNLLRSKAPTGFQAANAEAERRRHQQAARAADPVEQAVLYIRRRGRVIFRATVEGGQEGLWKYCGALLDGAAVMALAEDMRRLLAATRPQVPAAPPPNLAHPTNPATSATCPPRAPQAPVATPSLQPVGSAGQSKEETAMGHQFKAKPQEEINCEERGTTIDQVKRDLAALRDVLGTGGAADRLGVGKSSVGNILGGHAVVGPSILAALYGETGCVLKPSLAALLAGPSRPAPAPPADAGVSPPETDETTAKPEATDPAGHGANDVVYAAGTPVQALKPAASQAAEPPPVNAGIIGSGFGSVIKEESPIDMRSFLPDLAAISAADLLANAERRRAQLQAELAQVDQQIRAVLQLSAVAP